LAPLAWPRRTASSRSRSCALHRRRAATSRHRRAQTTPAVFGSADVTPLRTLEPGLHLLCLSNGPTLAFKDIALQLLGHLFEATLARAGETLNILGATSGDTGSAAEYAMRGKARSRSSCSRRTGA
jgi:threonine synthase